MHTMSGRQIIRRLVADGWSLRLTRGSHHQFAHPDRPGRVTVKHPGKDIAIGTLCSIYRQANWKWEDR